MDPLTQQEPTTTVGIQENKYGGFEGGESGYAKQHDFGHNCSVSDNPKSLAVWKPKHYPIKITFCYECWFTWVEDEST